MTLKWLEGPGGFVDSIQLDIVGFLAILGEGSITANLQVSTLSKLVFVPRLLPAPQVFFRPNRDGKLDPSPGNVTGVYSGNDKDFVNYIGHVVLDAEDMPDYSIRCVEIIKRADAKHSKVKARTQGPLSLLVLVGCLESIGILTVAIVTQDGFAILAIVLLSCLSSLAGLANWWYLELPKRRKVTRKSTRKGAEKPLKMDPPPGDVVVRYPKGSFLVVQCAEDVARELYFAPENVYYLVESPWVYRLMSLCGTLMLMMGIVALGNAQQLSQIIFAACYMALNAAYWLVAALPARVHWDLSMYEIRKQRIVNQAGDDDGEEEDVDDDDPCTKADLKTQKMADKTYTDLNPNFTWSLWKTIVATESIDWVKKNDALPETPVWNAWLQEALGVAKSRTVYWQAPNGEEGAPDYPVKTFLVPKWEPQEAFYKLLNKQQRDDASDKVERREVIEDPPPPPPSKRNTQASGFEAVQSKGTGLSNRLPSG